MSEGLNENTAIFIGCVIGIMILIIFGCIIWLCWYKGRLRQQHDNSSYKTINSYVNDNAVSSSDEQLQNGHNATNTNTTNGELKSKQTEMTSINNKDNSTKEYKQEEHEANENIIIDVSENEINQKPLLDESDQSDGKDESESHHIIVTDSDSDIPIIKPQQYDQDECSELQDSQNDNDSYSTSLSSSNNISDNSPINLGIALVTANVFGKQYEDTQSFDDGNFFEENRLPLNRLHLCCIKYWKSNDILMGIQCEWDLYNQNGNIIQRLNSQINYFSDEYSNQPEPEVCILDFGSYLYKPITIKMGRYINSISLMSDTQFITDIKTFGGHGGKDGWNMDIPNENIVIGFKGGFGETGMHNLSVISIPYKQSIGYNLIKHFLNEYKPELTLKMVACILDYVFYLNDIDTDMETWEQPRPDARGTCMPAMNYNEKRAMEDAKIIRQALRGIDDDKLLEITGRRSNQQRIMIRDAYKEMYDEKQPDLLADMEREFHRNSPTGELFAACYRDIGEFDARMIYKAIAGQGVDKYELNEIICTRTNQQIKAMKRAWEDLQSKKDVYVQDMKQWINGRSMIDCICTELDVESEYSEEGNNEDYKDFLMQLLAADRFENKKVSPSNISSYAKMLFNDKQNKRKRNQKQMCETLGIWSWAKIGALYSEFNKLLELDDDEGSLVDIIEQMFESNKDLGDALCVIVEFCAYPYDYWSRKINDALKGIGTNNDMLIRCIVCRCEIDLYQIRNVFNAKYGDGITLQEWIENETNGCYKDLLLLLCGYYKTEIDIMVMDDDNITPMTEMKNYEINAIKEDILSTESESDYEEEEDVLSEISDDDESEYEEEKLDDIILYDDIESEHIFTLLKMRLPSQMESTYFLGDRNKYKLPSQKLNNREYINLERDLRRLTLGLPPTIEENDRQYCKLVILKYYDILCETFKRYCLIGGDRNWLTIKGWKNLYKDLFICSDAKSCNEENVYNLYEKCSNIHDNKKHIKNIQSDWNGIWSGENDDILYKIKQMSDYKLKGFIKTFEFCDINGVLKHDSHSKKTRKLIIFYHRKTDENIPLKCEAILNNTENKIEIKYETIEESPNDHNNIQNGEFILNKIDELSENDNEKFKSVYGLLRYEFFDILLRLSQLKFDEFGTHNFKYQSFLKLIQDYIIPFIWDDINSVNTSKDSYQWLFKKDSKSLQKLFKMYSKQNTPHLLNQNEWNLLCKNLFNNVQIIGHAFNGKKKGGKPSKQDIDQSFQLAKTHLYHLNLTYNEFEKALQHLAHKIYKKKPRSKYDKVDYQNKLKQLLKWAVKLQQLRTTDK